MKKYYYSDGRERGETMTVIELINKLKEYPEELPVFGGWEGVLGWINKDGFLVDTRLKAPNDNTSILVIDVEDY